MVAARQRQEAAEYLPSQLEVLPDPELTVSYTNVGIDRFTLGSDPDSSLQFLWSQDVPRSAKRKLAGEVARADVGIAAASFEATRLRVRADVEIAYADLHRLARTEAILEGSRLLLGSIRDTARARYETGQVVLENVLRSQTELTKVDAEIAVLDQERRSIELRLAALLGRDADPELGPALAPLAVADLDSSALEAAALERAPELRTLRAIEAREQKRVDFARGDLAPDFAWSAGYGNRGGFDPLVLGGFGVRLPVHRKQKQQHALAQSDLARRAATQDVESARIDVLAEVRAFVAEADRAETLLRLYEEGVLPQARSALDAASTSFAAGRVEFLALIEDFLAVLRYEIETERQRADRVRAAAGLERLTGMSLVQASAASGDDHE